MKNRPMRRAGSLADLSDFPAVPAGTHHERQRAADAWRAFLARHGGCGTRNLSPESRRRLAQAQEAR